MGKKKTKDKKRQKKNISSFFKDFLSLKEEVSLRPFSIVEYVIGIIVLLGIFLIYLKTLTPDIGFHDSGDMISASFHLGICHPPGYPFYSLFGKLFSTLLPIGNIAYRFNLMSAIFASLACMMVYFIILKVGSGEWEVASGKQNNNLISRISSLIPAIVGALTLAFAVTFWEQAVVAEKYALNALFATILIFILLKWRQAVSECKNTKYEIRNTKSYLYLFASTLGLSFTHHMQTIFVVPASVFFIITVWWQNKKSLTTYHLPLTTFKMFCYFIVPLALYLYLPIRASAHPPLNWGDPATFPRFIDYITLKAYKHFFISSPHIWFQNLQQHITSFFTHQFTIWLVLIGLIGLVAIIMKRKITGIFLLLIILTDIASSIRYGISNIEDYYIPAFMIFSIFIGFGLMEISRLILSLVPNPLIITPLILLPIIPYTVHHFHCNHRNYYFAHDLAVGLLKNLDENAALFIKGDVNGFPVWYLHYVENKRKDVALIDTPFLFQDWYAEDIKYKYRDLEFDLYPKHGIELGKARFDDILIKNFDKRPFYQYSDEPIPKGFTTIPVWFFLKILKSGTPKAIVLKELEKGAAEIILRGINDPNVSKDAKANDIIRNCAGGYNNRGNNYLSMGMYDNAIEELKKSANIDPNLPVVYYNLGRAYSNKNMPQAAILNFKKAIELNPNFKDLHRRIGLLYESMGKIDEAIYEYLQEAKISPSVEIYNTLARLYYEKKQINKVIEQCQNILQLDPNNYEARKNLASLYLTQNRLQEAQTEFNILLSKYPNDTYAKNMLRVIQNKIP
jgi:tetratricopeptide (TPR) repeat protein